MEGDFTLMDQPSPPSQGDCYPDPVNLPKARVGASTNDQRFLLVFILGTYFGPDLREEIPRKSALQRVCMGLPPYSADELGGSVFKLSEIESIYYFVLRNSHPSARVKLQSLYKFLQGHLAPPVKENLEDVRQFTAFFPPHLHRQSRYKGTYKVIESMVFIDDPDVAYMKEDDIERFKRLSGLPDLALDREEARNYSHGQRNDRDDERQARFQAMAVAQGHLQDTGARAHPLVVMDASVDKRKRRKRDSQLDVLSLPSPLPGTQKEEKAEWTSSGKVGPALLLLPSLPSLDQWNTVINATKPVITFTGTAAARNAGPLIGLVDIGISEDAYLFRTALPGVRKEEGEFKCEVECDGKVMIKGTTTTGETRVVRNNAVFLMQTQYLCPPGPFTVSFSLPGPVEPNQFTGTFGSDGILEGIVMKQRHRSGAAALIFEP
ncbi:hypothetical protein M758_8G015300 [Ceratodon purpureus]|uniref:SHSP domain-containing protein n=1 Tax=Ceratodon purpureus TaxID=3225 RepID=A0A8T0GXG5_CERPU|nr:hypothetical protein KC19_8G015600 [Ceratodon purpureus]KAG0607271.1 hypothetical protein M758_8G015300 [Ceratodon purpureus]KAG0607273.1 hypothetical protein M758_8G015300 [Ceratodon purpureus]